MKKTLISLVLALLLVSSASASIYCNLESVVKSYVQGTSPSDVSMTCNNNGSMPVTIYKSGNFITLSPNYPINLNPYSSVDFTISFSSNTSVGISQGNIYFSDGTLEIPITANVTTSSQQQQQQDTSTCQINPSLVSYTQSIQVGTQMTMPKITFTPTNCNGALTLSPSSVTVQGGIITSSGQKPVSISSIVSDGVILAVDTTGLNTQQTYTSYLNINAFNKNFQIPFNIIVTSGTSPGNNLDVNNLPVCSLSATALSLNSSYSLVCTGSQVDLEIRPRVDNSYIQGLSVDKSSTSYTWHFKPIRFGETTIFADYYYLNSPVGTPFSQTVQIQSSPTGNDITHLYLLFTPSFDSLNDGDSTIIQIINNETGSLVDGSLLFINAVQLNQTGNTFSYTFNAGIDYELRAKSPGYNDLVKHVSIPKGNITIMIYPLIGDTSTYFNISTIQENCSLYIDNFQINSPYYGTIPSGNKTIIAKKKGFYDANLTLYVQQSLAVSSLTEFKKGISQSFVLNRNSTWTVNYKKDLNSADSQILNGFGDRIEFIPKDTGLYTIVGDGKVLGTYEIKGWDGNILGFPWYYSAVIIILAVIIIFIIYKRNQGGSDGSIGFSGSPINTGG